MDDRDMMALDWRKDWAIRLIKRRVLTPSEGLAMTAWPSPRLEQASREAVEPKSLAKAA